MSLADVLGDGTLVRTPERAVFTAKGLVVRVLGADVPGEGTLPGTPVRAVPAAKGLVTRVLSTMGVEIALVISSIRAVLARILLPARPRTHDQSAQPPTLRGGAALPLPQQQACRL